MRTAILVACMLVAAGGLMAADPVAAEDPREWCQVGEADVGPAVTCGPKGPVCLGVGVGVEHKCP